MARSSIESGGGFLGASMSIRGVWQAASKKLAVHGFEDAHLEAELLLRQILQLERAQFYSGLGGELTDSQLNELNGLLEQRLGHRPSAYLRHVQEFYGFEFYVDERVLVPRPETELLVDKALELAQEYLSVNLAHRYATVPALGLTSDAALSLSKRGTLRQAQSGGGILIADIGAGSGAIAIALAVHLRQARIYATDISPQALEVARLNCEKHGVTERVELLEGDLLAPLPEPVDIIVANLPYVPDSDFKDLPPEISRYEPRVALAGGADGLDYIRRLIGGAPAKLRAKGALLLEVGLGQAEAVAEMARKRFSSVTVAYDLAGVERVVIAKV